MTEAEKWLAEGIEKGFCSYDWCKRHDDGEGEKCVILVQLFKEGCIREDTNVQ